MKNETFDLAFLKNISIDNVEFYNISQEEGKDKLKQIINLVNINKEKFENNVISSCSNTLDFNYTFGDDETDDEMFEECFGDCLLIPCSRSEYQNLVETYKNELYKVTKEKQKPKPGTYGLTISEEDKRIYVIDRMRKIIDYDKLFSRITPLICIKEKEFSIEISDGNLFANPIVIFYNYNLKQTDLMF